MKYLRLISIAFIVTSCLITLGLGVTASVKPSSRLFATWSGLGMDKWASIWLVNRQLPGSERVVITPEFGKLQGHTYFDIPGSKYFRDSKNTTFEKIAKGEGLSSPELKLLTEIVHDVEINLWLPDKNEKSKEIEGAFRELQNRYGRESVPYSCYMQFFDAVFAGLEKQDFNTSTLKSIDCNSELNQRVVDASVSEISIEDMLSLLAVGKKIVFVDVREPEEFEEVHIPGAINLQLRNLKSAPLDLLNNADLVVSYCIKDFRGYEMARALGDLGVRNSVILNPFGLKGWLDSELPVFRDGLESESAAIDKLNSILLSHGANAKPSDAGLTEGAPR